MWLNWQKPFYSKKKLTEAQFIQIHHFDLCSLAMDNEEKLALRCIWSFSSFKYCVYLPPCCWSIIFFILFLCVLRTPSSIIWKSGVYLPQSKFVVLLPLFHQSLILLHGYLRSMHLLPPSPWICFLTTDLILYGFSKPLNVLRRQ